MHSRDLPLVQVILMGKFIYLPKVTCNSKVIHNAMVNPLGQLYLIQNHHGNTSLGMPKRMLPEKFNYGKNSFLNMNTTIPNC